MTMVFQELNVIYCELFALQAFEAAYNAPEHANPCLGRKDRRGSRPSPTKPRVGPAMDKQSEIVEEFVVRCLRGSSTDAAASGQSLSAQSYVSLLPTLWWFLGQEGSQKVDDPGEIFLSVITHATKAGPTSHVKQVATELVARLVLVCNKAYESHPGANSSIDTVRERLPRTNSNRLSLT